MAGNVISGKNGLADGISTLRNWSCGFENDVKEFFASNTDGAPMQVEGNDDWSGQAMANGASPYKLPGETFTFTGSVDGSKGVFGTVFVNRVEISIPLEEGEIITHTINFQGSGNYTLGAAVVSDATDPTGPSAIGCKLQTTTNFAAPSYANATHVRSMTITLEADNPAYNDSGTDGHTTRVAGNIKGSISWDVYEDELSNLPAEGTMYGVRAFVNATEYWELEWVMVNDVSGIEIDRDTGALLSATISANYSGFVESGGSVYQGNIVDPDVVTFWP